MCVVRWATPRGVPVEVAVPGAGKCPACRTYTAAVSDDESGPWEVKARQFELGTDGPSVILVGVDDSVTAARAAWYAAGLARRQRARIVAVYVEQTVSFVAASPAGATVLAAEAQVHDEIAADLRARADAVASELGITVRFIVAHG